MTEFRWNDGRGEIVADGKRLEALAHGPPPDQGPTIVMLHEGLGSVALWRDFPARLVKTAGWGAFAYSRAGYGRSDPVALPRPLDYMSREARSSLPAVLEAIGMKRGILLGHSDGASIAAIYAGEYADERVKGLVLMAPHVFTEEPGLTSIAEARRAHETGGLKPRLAKYHADVDNAFWGWNDAWLDPDFKAWNIEDAVGRWRVPALLVQGVDDQYGTLAQLRDIEGRSPAPVKSLILKACRHSPQVDQPQATLDAIVGFCEEVAPGSIGVSPPARALFQSRKSRVGRRKSRGAALTEAQVNIENFLHDAALNSRVRRNDKADRLSARPHPALRAASPGGRREVAATVAGVQHLRGNSLRSTFYELTSEANSCICAPLARIMSPARSVSART
jgi:pimeloyl-ACP methyl ester carboxylesterase